jgi:hypothetical protein
MDTADQNYFDHAFKLIQFRLTNIEAQVTLILNAEKKQQADARGLSFDTVHAEVNEAMISVRRELDEMNAVAQARIESEP